MVLRFPGAPGMMQIMMTPVGGGELRWVLGRIQPTAGAGCRNESDRLRGFCIRACLPDINDPIGYWQNFPPARINRDWLKGRKPSTWWEKRPTCG